MLTDISESDSLGTIQELTGRRLKVRLIEGNKLGTSGYYPADVLKEYGPKVFVKGTPMYLDHQTPADRDQRPFGRIDDFAGELAEDAYYENDGLYAEVEVFEHQAPKIKALKDKIGVSIRARGNSVKQTINGKVVPVFTNFTMARSADFVVRAGAGGKIVDVLESAEEDDSELNSEAQEERETMEKELIDALEAMTSKIVSAVESAVKVEEQVEEKVEESAVDYDKALEIAEALGSSSLDADGRARVLDLHRANGKPLAELIAAEEAYVKAHKPADVEEAVEEAEAEESAKEAYVPRHWKVSK